MEYLIHLKHSVKIVYKYNHFPRTYRRKRQWVFFLSEHSVQCTFIHNTLEFAAELEPDL